MKKMTLVIIAALIVAGLTLAAAYQGRGAGCRMGPHFSVGRMLNNPDFIEKMGLTPEQVDKLKQLHFNHQKKMIGLQSSLKMFELELGNLMDADKLDKNLIKQKVKDISAVKADIALEKVDMKLSAADILTKEQIAKFKQMAHRFMEKRVMKRIDTRDGPRQRMMERQRMPGGGVWIDEEDDMLFLPPPDDEELVFEEEIEEEM